MSRDMINYRSNLKGKLNPEVYNNIENIYKEAVNRFITLPTFEFLKDYRIEIILTDDQWETVSEIGIKYNIDIDITRRKSYWAVIKTIINPKDNFNVLLVININELPLFNNLNKIDTDNISFVIAYNLIGIDGSIYLPKFISEQRYLDLSYYKEYFEWILFQSLDKLSKYLKLKGTGLKCNFETEPEPFKQEFMRNVVAAHFKYQHNGDITKFNRTIALVIQEYLERSIELDLLGYKWDKNDYLETITSNIIYESKIQLEKIINSPSMKNDSFELHILELLKYCFIIKSELVDGYTFIEIMDNPKKLFKTELIETKTSIVAFIDILGFKQFISDHDENQYSNVLSKIKNAIDDSILSVTSNSNFEIKSEWQDDIDYIEYRMFSDCFTFAIPFFDNEVDYLNQLTLMLRLIRDFQYKMLLNGFIIRGGISIGSFFSDRNMIFSKGLVNAYEIESKVSVVPRIIVDEKILIKIKEYYSKQKVNPFLEDILIRDKILDSNYFINSFQFRKFSTYDGNETTSDSYKKFETLMSLFKITDDTPVHLNPKIDQEFRDILNFLINSLNNQFSLIEIYIQERANKKYLITLKVIDKYIWLLDLINWYHFEDKNEDRFSRYTII